MNPGVFLLFAYLLLGLQVGLGDVFAWGAWGPELPLLGVIFVSLRARADAAVFGAMLLGLGRDLIGPLPPGLHVVGYGLVAILTTRASRQLLPNAPAVHAGLALGGSLLMAALTLTLAWLRPDVTSPGLWSLLTSALLTALLAPAALGLFGTGRKLFAFRKRSFDPR